MTEELVNGTPPKQFSPALITLMSIIARSNTASLTAAECEEVVRDLVALRNDKSLSQESALGLKDLTVALRTSFCDFLPASLNAKIEMVGWVASLLQSQATYKTRTICAVIQELAEVLKFRWLKPENAEHWFPMLNPHPMSKSASFKAWCKEAFEVQNNYYAFLDTQILPSAALRDTCGAKEAISEFRILNLACKAFIRMIPFCYDTSEHRLNREGIVFFICLGTCSNAQETLNVAKLISEREKAMHKRAFTLLRFFVSHLRHIIQALAVFLCRVDHSALKCRNYIRFTLFHLRSRLLSNDACAKMHPTVYSDVVKFIGPLEDACIGTLLEGAEFASNDEKFEVFYEFCYSGRPNADQLKGVEPLTPYEWNYGRLHIILRTMTVFEQLPCDLQLRLFPPSKTMIGGADHHQRPGSRFSLVALLFNCLGQLRQDEFVPLMDRKAQQSSEDIYLQVLSDLTIFSLLVQPAQFTTLRVEMLGWIFHSSEVISLLAMDWWRCMADRLGQSFTVDQVLVLSEMLSAIPNGVASNKLSRLIRSLCLMLDAASQIEVAESVLSKLDGLSSSLLSNFPFGSLSGQSLEHITNNIMATWRGCFEHLEDLNIVVDVFYAMYPYIASLVSIFSSPQLVGELPVEVKQSVVEWCVNLLFGCQELISFAQSRPKSVEKISYTVEHVVTLLRVLQPLSTTHLIQVLSTFAQWIHLTEELRPLSPCGLAQFLTSCGAIDIFDEEEKTTIRDLLKTLYAHLLEDSHWLVVSQALSSLAILSVEARNPEILHDVIPATYAESVRRYQHHELLPEHTTPKAEKEFWRGLQLSLDGFLPSSASVMPATSSKAAAAATSLGAATTVMSTTTLRDLKTLSNPVVSKQECLQGLRAATTYLERLAQDSPEGGLLDQGLRAQLAAEMGTLQSLMQRLITPQASDKDDAMPGLNSGR
ncbi:hypothetical protein DFQ26_007096 [Actinomortierella ambigua]|nr:hypothetical protein DFQ26_007096 [Actinomortierella ambigua]